MESHNLCTEYPEFSKIINICDYSITELALVFTGTIFWVVVYVIIIRNSIKNKYVEMPVPAAASNLAWEFAWGFLFTTDMGLLFVWGLRIWFILDVFIFYNVLRYGDKQISTPLLKKYFKPIELASVFLWTLGFYFFIKEGYDTSMGATSAYIITIIMASLYSIFFLSSNFKKGYSLTNAWCKMLGNALMSVFVFIHYPDMHFLQFTTIVVFILDVVYIPLVKMKSR